MHILNDTDWIGHIVLGISRNGCIQLNDFVHQAAYVSALSMYWFVCWIIQKVLTVKPGKLWGNGPGKKPKIHFDPDNGTQLLVSYYQLSIR